MLTNKQSLYLSGIIIIGFFVAGLIDFFNTSFSILDHLIIKIIFGTLFFLIIINLFLEKRESDDDFEDTLKKEDNYLK